MKKQILNLKIILALFIFSVIFLSTSIYNKSYAKYVSTYVSFCNSNNGTTWGVTFTYYDGTTNSPLISNMTVYTSTGANYSGSPCAGYINMGNYNLAGHVAPSSAPYDYVYWFTACVDPTSIAYVSGVDSGSLWYVPINVTCSSDCIGGYPASCDNPNNHSTVNPGDVCPSGPYCMIGGKVNSSACSTSNSSYCPGAFNGSGSQSCSGYTCVSAIPAPPTGLNATPWCNGTASRMTFGWNVSSGATSYNLTWNNPTGSYNNMSSSLICSGSTCSFSPNIAFTQGVLINWSIAACNSSGCSVAATGAKTSNTCTSTACGSTDCSPACTGTQTCTGTKPSCACTGGTVSCPYCDASNTCQTQQVATCSTNCSACSGVVCMKPNILLNEKKG